MKLLFFCLLVRGFGFTLARDDGGLSHENFVLSIGCAFVLFLASQ